MSKRSKPSIETAISHSPQETRDWGRALARTLPDRACLLLIGNLGAGKTTLVKGIAEELGIDPNQVISPTFVLIKEHFGNKKLIHADAYRTADPDEFLEVGLAEYFEQDVILVIEWGEKLSPIIPQGALRVEIELIDPTTRKLTLKRS